MKNKTKTLLAEGVLIVVSILVAFAIDAWWSDRQEQVEERLILESLRSEFLSNAQEIPAFIAIHEVSATYTRELIFLMKNAQPGESVLFSVAKLAHVINHRSTDPQRGALDAMLQSGGLARINNPDIRERLAGWPRLVVDATENEELLRRQWNPMLFQAMARTADLSALEDLDIACWSDATLDQCATSEISLPWNSEVLGLLMPIAGYTSEAARELGMLVVEAEVIAGLIENELGVK